MKMVRHDDRSVQDQEAMLVHPMQRIKDDAGADRIGKQGLALVAARRDEGRRGLAMTTKGLMAAPGLVMHAASLRTCGFRGIRHRRNRWQEMSQNARTIAAWRPEHRGLEAAPTSTRSVHATAAIVLAWPTREWVSYASPPVSE